MKRLIITCFMALGMFAAKAGDLSTVCFSLTPALTCNHCEEKIKNHLRFEKGVKGVKVMIKNNMVEVSYDAKKTEESKLEESFRKIGYSATPVADVEGENAKEMEVEQCPIQ